MTKEQGGQELIEELLSRPREFDSRGGGYALLQFYFEGLPIDTLRPLLRSDNLFVQRTAAFIASELGDRASILLDDIAQLTSSADGHVQWYAMEVIAVCSKGERAEMFAHVIRALESDSAPVRRLAMRLTANADISQLEAVSTLFGHQDDAHETHRQALAKLTAGERTAFATIFDMTHDANPLVRRYGAIAAKRLAGQCLDLVSQARSSEDPDVQDLCGGGSEFDDS
jgi:hypothetical protein